MEENPKTIWNKPWRGWAGLLLACIALFVVILAIGLVLGAKRTVFPYAVGFALAVFLLAAFIRGVRWLFCWRNFKRFSFGLACFITLVALFYAEENWRGKRDWKQFKQAEAARGENFDWQAIIPPPVPDDQNFAFSPVWIAEDEYNFQNQVERAKAWYGDWLNRDAVAKFLPLLPISTSTVTGTNMWRVHQPPENSIAWTSGQALDLKPWQSFYHTVGKTNAAADILVAPRLQTPAQDVLLALSKFDPAIEQLRQDSKRPDARFPIQYDGLPAAILLPHLAAEKRIAEVLQLRALAELQNGESEPALADIKLMLRLLDASRNEPFLICHLVRLALLNLALQPVWEGLADHKWSDAQLADLEVELARLDFLADAKAAIRGERGLEIANIEFLQHPFPELPFHHPRLYFLAPVLSLAQMLANMSSDNGDTLNVPRTLALSVGPSGWLEQNKLRIARFDTQWLLPVIDEKAKIVSPEKVRAADAVLDKEKRQPSLENVFLTLFIPGWRKAAEKFAHGQCSTDQARVAIALERYRLAKGNFPESLDRLAPQFITEIPHDVIGGGPLHYRRTPAGLFVLYSVGWNETDDGGVMITSKGKTPREETYAALDLNQGDWVWKYPQK